VISPPSFLSLAAASFYGLVMMACSAAAFAAQHRRQQGWHLAVWLLLGAVFVLFAMSRISGFEEAFRDSMRMELRSSETYSERRDFQRPIAALVVAFIGASGLALVYRTFRRLKGRTNLTILIGLSSTFGLAGLVVLRLISLSPVDKLLYGPLKLNWILDLGLSALTMGAAVYYVHLLLVPQRKKP
jgi:hypothetical protein